MVRFSLLRSGLRTGHFCFLSFVLLFALASGCQCGADPAKEEKGAKEQPAGESKSEVSVTDTSDGAPVDRADAGDAAVDDVSPDNGGSDSPLTDASEPSNGDDPDGGVGDGSDGGDADSGPDFNGPRFHFRVNTKTEDTVPPKLISLTFLKPRIKAGELLELSVEVGKDLSDVVSVQVSMKGPSPGQSMYVDTQYHPSKKRFISRFQTSPYAAAGDWTIDRVYLQDGARNPGVYRGDMAPLKGLKLVVDKNLSDDKGPSMTSLTFAQTGVKAGESLGYSLSVTDDVSGVDSVEVSVSLAAGGKTVRSTATYHPLQKKYIGLFRIPMTGPNGKWQVKSVDLRDNAGNFSSLFNTDPLLKGKEFSVSDAATPPPPDTTKPVLRSAFLTPLIVNAGQQIRLFADAEDKGSGIRSIEARVSDPTSGIKFQFNLYMNASTGLWEGTGLVPFFSRLGIWRIQEIQVLDVAGNVNQYPIGELQQNIPFTSRQKFQDRKPHLFFDVTPPAGPRDEQGPIIKGFHLSPGTAKAGESVRVFTQLQEPGDSGISSASCTFDGPDPSQRPRAILAYNSDTGFYEGNVTFPANATTGDWWVSGCFLSDNAGNSSSVPGWMLAKLPPLDISRATSNPAKDPFVISVSGGVAPPADQQPPTMSGAQFAPGSIKAGERVQLHIAATDPGGSGIASGRCQLKAVGGLPAGNAISDQQSISLALNPATGYWEGSVRIPRESVLGEWVLQRCDWRDRAGNRARVQGAAFDQVSVLALNHIGTTPVGKGLSFEVTSAGPPSSDQTAPTLEKVAVAPNMAKAGELVRVYAQIKEPNYLDLLSGFCSLKPSVLDPPRSSYGAAHLRWNPATKLWEGTYRVPSRSRGGTWSLAGCQLEDVARNSEKTLTPGIRQVPALDLTPVLSRQLQKRTTLRVASTTSPDKTPPTAKDFKWLPKTAVKAGEALLFQLDATDTGGSIVLRVEVAVRSPSGKFQVREALSFNPATNRWEGVFRFPLEGEDGTWTVSRVDVSDFAANVKSYVASQGDLKGLDVSVSGSQVSADKLPPVVKQVSRSKGIVVAGTSFRVAADITDDVSGVGSASIRFSSSSGKFGATSFLAWNANTKKWEGEVEIPLNSEDGVWKPTGMNVQDRAGRSLQLNAQDAVFAGVVVTVRGSKSPTDTTPPTIQILEISPAQIKPGESFRVVAEAKDDISGIASISVQLIAPQQARRLFINLEYDAVTKRYVSTQQLHFTSPPGQWVVSQIDLADKAGNRTSIRRGDPFLP